MEISANHEIFEFEDDKPYLFFPIEHASVEDDQHASRLHTHWHEELEMVYCTEGFSTHYINGEVVESRPGRVIVTNCEFMHSIALEPGIAHGNKPSAYCLIIQREFLRTCFPQYDRLYFTNQREVASPAVRQRFKELIEVEHRIASHHTTDLKETGVVAENLRSEAIILELLYALAQDGMVERSQIDDIGVMKQIHTMKEVLAYIRQHYGEKLPQSQMAKRFHFSIPYFSKYFKQMMGCNYSEYVTEYRVYQAEKLLRTTDLSVSEVAHETGFTDDRRLILAFKNRYDSTPLQYRKHIKHKNVKK